MPLAKAQTFAAAENHASMVFVLLHDQDQTDRSQCPSSSSYEIVTWSDLNELSVQSNNLRVRTCHSISDHFGHHCHCGHKHSGMAVYERHYARLVFSPRSV